MHPFCPDYNWQWGKYRVKMKKSFSTQVVLKIKAKNKIKEG